MSEPDEYFSWPDSVVEEHSDKLTDHAQHLEDLENRVEYMEQKLGIYQEPERLDIITGMVFAVVEALYYKVISEGEQDQEEFLRILDNAIRENIIDRYKVQYRLSAKATLNRVVKMIKQPTASELLKLYSPAPSSKKPKKPQS